jgi:hypothetical protein
MKLSLVNGTAFVDFSAAGALTPYICGQLTITDSSGRHLVGFIKAAGSGETYGSELMSNTNFAATTGIGSFNTTLAIVGGGQSGNALQVTLAGGQSYGNAENFFPTTSGSLRIVVSLR